MKVHHKLATVLSFTSQFHPDKKVIFHVVKKALKTSFKENKHAIKTILHITSPKREKEPAPPQPLPETKQESLSAPTPPLQITTPLKNELTEKMERLFTALITLELLIACYTPWDVPEDSIAYPLFSYGTKMLHLEGIFQILASERPSDVRYVLAQPLFAAARTTRLIARSLHLCVSLHGRLTRNTREELDHAHQTQMEALARVEEAQTVQESLIQEAGIEAKAQRDLISQLPPSDPLLALGKLKEQLAKWNDQIPLP